MVGVWATGGRADRLDVSGRVVQSGSGRGAAEVPVWSVRRSETSGAEAFWSGRKLCRTCVGGTEAWAELGPESVCWAF